MAKIKPKLNRKPKDSEWEIVPHAQVGKKITLDEFRPKFESDKTKVNKVIVDPAKGYKNPIPKNKQDWYNKSSGRIEESISPLDFIPIGSANTSYKLFNTLYNDVYRPYSKISDYINMAETANDLYNLKQGGKIQDQQGYLASNLHNFTPKKVIKGNKQGTIITTDDMAFPISANGQMLFPNKGDYYFPESSVTEYPIKAQVGTQVRPTLYTSDIDTYTRYMDSVRANRTNANILSNLRRRVNTATNEFGVYGLYENFSDLLPPYRTTESTYPVNNTPSVYEDHTNLTDWNAMGTSVIEPTSYVGFDRSFRPYRLRGTNLTVGSPFRDDNHEYVGVFQFPPPVQPYIYQPLSQLAQNPNPSTVTPSTTQTYKSLQRPKEQPIQLQSKSPDLLQSNNNLGDINPIPFAQGTYFTRPRQSQEPNQNVGQFPGRVNGKTDYFDKKTGKLLGTYQDGGETSEWEIID